MIYDNTMKRKIKNVLITGINGSGGSYLCEYLNNSIKDIIINGFSRWHSTSNVNNLDNVKNKINQCQRTILLPYLIYQKHQEFHFLKKEII